jgi:hypothetical protein
MRKTEESSLEKELFNLADELSQGNFWLPEEKAKRERLMTLARSYWQDIEKEGSVEGGAIKREDIVKQLAFIIRLILTCPDLLDRPPGFEWAIDTLKQELLFRKYNPTANKAFWEALQKVRGMFTGRPRNFGKDWAIHTKVMLLMEKDGLSKTKAVEKLAEELGKEREDAMDTSTIWKALERFEKIWDQFQKRWNSRGKKG